MMVKDAFFKRLHDAEAAGLNKEAALEVAYKFLTLDEALGDMYGYGIRRFLCRSNDDC